MESNILLTEKEIEIDVQTLFDSLKNFKYAKMTENKINEDTKIFDLKLLMDDINEVEFYGKYPNVKKYFTRGLSFLFFKDKISILRKGLNKFFNFDEKLDKLNFELNDLNENHSLIVMNKEDGMNVQITYEESLKSLVICSKNVSIICNNLEDLKKYETNNRYSAGILIAKYFLNKYQLTEDLINVLKNYILVGEYMGNIDNLIVNFYNIEKIKFFTLINKNNFCKEKPLEYLDLFKKLNLEIVEYDYIKIIDKKKFLDMKNGIENKSLSEAGEGKVFYLLENGYLIKMFKIKPDEFRLFFHIKRNLVSKKISFEKNYPQIIEFYKEIIKEFDKLNFNAEIYFSLVLMNVIQKIKDSYKFDLKNEKLFILKNIRHEIEFKNKITKNKEIVLIIPSLLPGSGKTFFRNEVLKEFILERGFDFKYLSTDETVKTLMEENKSKYPNLTEDELFDKFRKQSTDLYKKKLIDIVKNYDEDKILFIYLDKNHLKNGMEYIYRLKENYDYIKLLALTNKNNNENIVKLNDKQYFFDYNFVINLIRRLINRKDHETLNRGVFHSLNIMFNFLKSYINSQVKDFYKYHDHSLLEVEFTKNNLNNIQNYSKIEELINIIISKISFKTKNELDNYFKELIELVSKENLIEITKKEIIISLNETFHKFIMKYIFIDSFYSKQKIKKKKSLKNPLYYGIFFEEKFNIDEFLNSHNIFLTDIDTSNFKFIEDLHVTCKFFGKKKIDKNDYKLKYPIKVYLKKIIYIEGLCVIIKIKTNDDSINIENNYPHITFMINPKKFKPVESNSILHIIKENDNIYEIDFKKQKYNVFIENSIKILNGITSFCY